MRGARPCQAGSPQLKTMELILSEEQKLLQDSAARFMQQSAGAGLVRRVRESDVPFDAEIWRQMAAAHRPSLTSFH